MAKTIIKGLRFPQPTVADLVDIVREYNVARAQELSQKPATGWPEGYSNTLMNNLYDAAAHAAGALSAMLKTAESVSLEVKAPAPRFVTGQVDPATI